MEINAFARKMCHAVARELGENYTVEWKEVKKNNGVILHGMLIHSGEQNVVPTIYLDSFWEAYESGIPFAAVLQKLLQVYREDTPKNKLDMDFFYSLDGVKDRICYRIIRKKGNESLLEEIPHMEILDLCICFFYAFQNKGLGEGAIMIHNSHMEMWKTNLKKLYEFAKLNTPRIFPWECHSMEAMLAEMTGMEDSEDLEGMFRDIPMKILSNVKRVNGATCMIYPNLAECMAESMGGSYYILPSSIHEVILLKDTGEEDPFHLKSMIEEVNANMVAPEEVLSNSLYYYGVEDRRIRRLL